MASVGKRYSDALFLAAENAGTIPSVEADMQLLGFVLEERDLRLVLADPKRSTKQKSDLLVRLLQGDYSVPAREPEQQPAEGAQPEPPTPQKRAREASPLTLSFLDLVFEKKRAGELLEITRSFHRRVLESRGEIEGRVESYEELSPQELGELEKALSARIGTRVTLRNEVDPELLGGLRIFVGDRFFDASLRGQLEELGHRLRGAPLPVQRGD